MKKKLLLALSMVLVVGMASLGILAYFTDSDAKTNVFTVGNVDIELVEKMQNPENEGELIDWESHELVPGGDYPYDYAPNASWYNKVVFVKNTGTNDAWVRVKFKYDADLEPVLHLEGDQPYYTEALVEGEKTYEVIDGNKYAVETYYTKDVVAAGKYFGTRSRDASSEPALYDMYDNAVLGMVWLDESFDWEVEEYGWYSYEQDNGKRMTILSEDGVTFDVIVEADAIQDMPPFFGDYTEAFEAFDEQKAAY